MSWGFKKELGRKAIHLLSISILIVYLFFTEMFNHNIALFILSFLLILSIEIEYFRIELGKDIPLISLFWKYKRQKEKYQLGAEVFFLIGAIIVLAIFDLRIAAAAILMTTFGDSASAIIGQRFGRIKIYKERALEGILAELFIDLLIGFLFVRTLLNGSVWWINSIIPAGQPIWPVIIVMALTATIVETLSGKLNDNLLIPLFSGFNGHVALFIMVLIGMI
jgi:dolichol kinase